MTAAHSRHAAFVIALALPLVLIACVYIAQYGFGLPPCEMCWWQRYGHFAAIGFALAGWSLRKSSAGTTLIALAGLAIGVSAGIGLLHAGVEYHWWTGPTACSTTRIEGDALSAIMNAPLVRCDTAAWTLVGVSLAGYNFLVSSLGALAVYGLLVRGSRSSAA
ncbi:disulfide bond formation protein B [Novosphingobium sp.]|uniref:disulfide bond formation protein B n=1 Tax=Novosphingobium sp. TaxID=1874826 RepID=UPI00260080D1|nr:disulfide bond formation protein B [Novosphingobium sp.]